VREWQYVHCRWMRLAGTVLWSVVFCLPVLKFLVLLGLEPLLVGHVTKLSYFWLNKQTPIQVQDQYPNRAKHLTIRILRDFQILGENGRHCFEILTWTP
jgi:hypothetical protein